MDEFLIQLQAILDKAKSEENINKSINRMQNRLNKLKIQTEIDPKAVQKLANDIGKLLNQKIVISNIGIDTKSGIKAGQEYGKQINQGISQGIKENTSVLNSFKKSLENIGMGSKEIEAVANRINNLGVQIETLNQTRSSGKKDILSVNIAGIDQYGQAIKLTQQYNTSTGELINTINNVSTVQQKAGVSAEVFIEKQKNAVASAQNTLATIESKLHDKGANKTLANTDFNANGLNNQINAVKSAIDSLDNASKNTFAQAQRDVDREISILNNLISTLKNAEYTATSLRTKDVTTVKINESNKLDAFVQKMEQSGHYTDELKRSVSNLRNQLDGIFNKNDVDKLTSYLNGFSNLQTRFKAVDEAAKTVEKSTKLKTNIDSEKKILQVYTTELKDAGVLTGDIKSKIQEMVYLLSKIDSQTGLTTWRAEFKGVKAEIDSVLKSVAQLSQKKIDQIQLSIDNGHGASEYQNRINSVTASLEKYGVETQEAKKITDSLQSTFDSMKGLSGQELITQADKLEQEFKAVGASVNQAKLSYDKYIQPASKEKISSTLLKVQKLLDNNTKVTEEVKNEWQGYVNRLSSGSDIAEKEINDINIRLKQTESNMRSMGKLGLSLTDKIKQAWKKFGEWGFATGTMMALVNQLRKIPKEVYEIDTAMTNLYKVTDETSSKYNQFLDSTSDSAEELGRSISSLVEQTANWAKLGFSLDEAEQLAKISSIYANVGEVDDDTAVSDMVTAMKAFNIEASDSITIVDKLNKLGNEFATSSAALGDGLSRSASAMATAGTDINKTLAMLTGGTEITQNASEFGNFLKIGSMRIRGKILCLHTRKVCMRCCA